ncbi:MAG: BlaI/MecI/CopY family transcriptional regulator [Oscillospiraceae bacterium]|jgi:BlaI family penicillinase repressor|nr:BlaI/MecI/CopY family transcriptional regulator [Oscillospiraceae bacterium]
MEKLYDSELKVMNPLWVGGPQPAGTLAKKLAQSCGWNRNTTYTVIKKLIHKGAVSRSDPGFVCTPLVTREEVQRMETESLIARLFDDSKAQFLSAFLSGEGLAPAEAAQLRALIDSLEER